jgi:Tfp pilus assembly protein PilO
MKKKIKEFTEKIGAGLKQEYQETKDIPKHIKNGNYKEVGQQVADIGKMAFIVTIWILPAGAIISGFIMKLSNTMRPTSFQVKEDEDSCKKKTQSK